MPSGDIQSHILETYNSRTRASKELQERAMKSMPGGDTRSIAFFAPYPTFFGPGRGCRVTDVDGNEYLDLVNNYTSLIHGHSHETLTEAISNQAAKGTCHAAPLEQQIALAEALVQRVPALDHVRFCNSGTEAVMSVVRVARAYTGRLKILKMEGGYHGMWETVQVSVEVAPEGEASPVGQLVGPGFSPRAAEETLVAPFNDLEATARLIRENKEDLAAVLVEPVMGAAGMIPPEPGFLNGLQQVCQETGVLLVADEIITLRLAYGGAQSLYEIQPDLTTFGKLIGGGLPVGAFGGRADVMSVCDPRGPNPVFHSGTFTGNAVTMAAGLASLKLLDAAAIERINRLGQRLQEGLAKVLEEVDAGGCVTGVGSMFQVHFASPPVTNYRSAHSAMDQIRPWLHLALLNRGIFTALRGLYCASTPMGEAEVDRARTAFKDALEEVKPLMDNPDSIGSPAEFAKAATA